MDEIFYGLVDRLLLDSSGKHIPVTILKFEAQTEEALINKINPIIKTAVKNARKFHEDSSILSDYISLAEYIQYSFPHQYIIKYNKTKDYYIKIIDKKLYTPDELAKYLMLI